MYNLIKYQKSITSQPNTKNSIPLPSPEWFRYMNDVMEATAECAKELEASGLSGEDLRDAIDLEQMGIMKKLRPNYDLSNDTNHNK
jgi:hypothetical protein